MYISRFQLNNYKSFLSPTHLELTPGFTVITGQNNAGKTALLEGLSLQFSSKPHRSLKTIGHDLLVSDPSSWADISFTLGHEELWQLLPGFSKGFDLPLPPNGTRLLGESFFSEHNHDSIRWFAEWLLSQPTYTFNLTFQANHTWRLPEGTPSYGLYQCKMSGAHRY
jgi:AAA domain-containing protein